MVDTVFESLFNPRSVAVIGASNTFGKWGFNIFNRVLASADGRRVFPVNAEASEVVGIKAYKRVTEIPEPVELAVVTIPPQYVLDAVRDCVEKRVKVIEIITAGFGEAGAEGAEAEREAVAIARRGGVRVVGPNSMGHLNTHADFYTTPWITGLPTGGVGLISQSGNFGINIVRRGTALGIGFSKFISSGNEADLTFEDYLEYFAADPQTKVIAAYVEGLRQGRRFLTVARKATRRKPVIILKAGRTHAGARAARSHTAALAGEDQIYNAAFKQTGVIRVNEVDEILDAAGALIRQPLPRGRRVAILTGGGGPGVIAADACARAGLELADLQPETIAKLDRILPPRWPRGNPVDMVGETNLTYPCLLPLIEDENVDAVFSLAVGFADAIRTIIMDYVKPELQDQVNTYIKLEEQKEIKALNKLIQRMDALGKPVFLFPPSGIEDFGTMRHLRENGILTYASIERGARVLAHLADYADYLRDLTAEQPHEPE